MKNRLWIVLMCLANLFSSTGEAQEDLAQRKFEQQVEKRIHARLFTDYENVKPYFEEAYLLYPTIPKGFLEAVSFQYTHFSSNQETDDAFDAPEDMPRTYSVMGLTYDGKGVFRENLKYVSTLSGIGEDALMLDDRQAVLAYASAFASLQQKYNCYGKRYEDYKYILTDLSELPLPVFSENNSLKKEPDQTNEYAIQSFLYVIYLFLSDTTYSDCGSPGVNIDFKGLFGDDLPKLRSPKLSLTLSPDAKHLLGTDYAGAVWNAAATCNYVSGRGNTSISNVTIHYTSGTYAGAIAWFKNCNAQVSAHYVIRSIDGQITQMVRECDKAWHVGSANGYTIGIEHEAYGNIWSFFTPQMYQSSAGLVSDICQRYPNMNALHVFYKDTLDDGTVLNTGLHSLGGASACTQIRGHQHFPSQTHTDPGPYWDWNYYYKLINANTVVQQFTADTGTFTDSGGLLGDYGDDERNLYHFHVAGADSIVLDFSSFSLEPDCDFMWIYAGNSVFSPKMGRWNTNSPGRVVVPGEDVMVEFRSDCAIAQTGWVAHWQGCFPTHTPQDVTQDTQAPQTDILLDESVWYSQDFVASFVDTDDVALKYRFYQVMEKNGNVWTANPQCGFLCDNFDGSLDTSIWHTDNGWNVDGNVLHQQANMSSESVAYAKLDDGRHDIFLYDFYMNLEQGNSFSFVFHGNQQPFNSTIFKGYQILFDKNDNSMSIIRRVSGSSSLLKKVNNIYYTNNQNYRYRIVWNRNTGDIQVFRHSNLLGSVRDSTYVGWTSQTIAFVSHQSKLSLDNVRVYGSRGTSETITVGPDNQKMIRSQSINESVAAKVKSIVLDSADHFSALVEKNLKVDYSAPDPMDTVMVSWTFTGGILQVNAHWPHAIDVNSGIKGYYYRVMYYPGMPTLSFRPKWILLGSGNSMDRAWQIVDALYTNGTVPYIASLPETQSFNGQPYTVYFQLRAENKAGLFSDPKDVRVMTKITAMSKKKNFRVYPNPCRTTFEVERNMSAMESKHQEFMEVLVYDMSGREIYRNRMTDRQSFDLSNCPNGLYLVRIIDGNETLQSERILKIK